MTAILDLNQAVDPHIPKNLVAELGPYGRHIQQSVYGRVVTSTYELEA